jgi:branched-chain amino acid aminotransferase
VAEVYIDGKFLDEKNAAISVLDRAVQLGDGLFETIRGHFGKPAFLEQHLTRMRSSARFLQLPFDRSDDEIREVLTELCRRNEAPEARIRLTLTRGTHPGGLQLAGGVPSFIATTEPYTPHPPEKYEEGYALIVSGIVHYSKGALTGHKTLNYLPFLLARDEAARANADEALLLNEFGNAAECSSANIFCVSSGEIVTPDTASGILTGVVRDIITGLAKSEGIKAAERPLPLLELKSADEVFITSSLRGVMPVSRIGDSAFGKEKPVTEKLSQAYSAALDDACRA